jgi:replicative DNA helicase
MAHNAHDFMTERALLSAMIQYPDRATQDFLAVPVDAFYQPKHQAIAAIIRDKLINREGIDANTVLATVMDQGLSSRIHAAEIFSIIEHHTMVTNTGEYARWLCELYGRRRAADEFARELQRLDAEWESGDPQPLAATLERIRVTLEELVSVAAPLTEQAPPTLADLLAGSTEYDWIVPGLLERMDRLVLTGDEGFGKSEFIAQTACCVAAGIHPFSSEEIEGAPELRVTIMDCENSPSQSRRRYRRMVGLVDSTRAQNGLPPVSWDKRLFVDFAPGGMDLLKGGDAVRLERYVAATAPDILVVGPLYKLHRTDMNNEEAARELVGKLDVLRERYGVAIITEAHAGNSKDSDGNRLMRPRGSSLFLGWPEFGFGLRRIRDQQANQPVCADVVSWRGARDERSWPIDLVRSQDNGLPWKPGTETTQMYWDSPRYWDPQG